MNSDSFEYECECGDPLEYRLTFDGGSTGEYVVEYCQKCYDLDNKLYLIKEERIMEEEK